jgi:NTP pyrophosphatase (non-canonical NTP hydrolase)
MDDAIESLSRRLLRFEPWVLDGIERRMDAANARYGRFASTHEALGVALEEWQEFVQAIRSNDMHNIEHEALDLAAVLIRLAQSIPNDEALRARSTK